MLAAQPQKREVSQESTPVAVAEIKLVEYSFKGTALGPELQGTRVLSTSTVFESNVRSRVKITDQAIARSEAELSKGNTVTAQTARRGIPVARITPQIEALPFSKPEAYRFSKPEAYRQPSSTPQATPSPTLDIFSSLTAPILTNALANAITELLTESPAEKEKRILAEKREEEKKRQELQSLQQAALAERNELAAKIPSRNLATKSEIGALDAMISSTDIGTVKNAIAIGKNIEARAQAETEISIPRALQEDRQEAVISISNNAINELQMSYQTKGAEGIFSSLVLEALTSASPTAEALETLTTIRISAPTMFAAIVNDLEAAISQPASAEHALIDNSEVPALPEQLEALPLEQQYEANELTADRAITFARYAEISGLTDDNFAGLSFSSDLRERSRDLNESLAA
jgi:hypothetical protein